MSAESDAQMQHFVSAVYSQNDASGEGVSQVELASIESRSIKFSKWRESADEAGEPGVIPERLLRHWVDADIASFRRLDDEVDAEIAADNIAANYRLYDEYCKEMQALAGDVAAKVDEINAASRQRGIEQDRVSAKDLVARLRDTESQRNLPADTSALDGFTAGGPSVHDDPNEPIVARKVLESITYKSQVDGSVLYLVHERPAFTDHGRHILVDKKALTDEESILAAVLLAKEKYGGAFSLTGSEEFKRKALEVIVKNNIDVKLKSPGQEMLLREIAEHHPGYKYKPKMPMELEKTPNSDGPQESPSPDENDADFEVVNNSSVSNSDDSNSIGELRAVRAVHWWEMQNAIIAEHVAKGLERDQLIEELGSRPSDDTIYWFDSAGNHVANPGIDALRSYENTQFNNQLHGEEANRLYTREVEAIDSAINHMRKHSMSDTENKHPVLRGVMKDPATGEFDTSVLLFKGKGDYLQGFIKVDGVKQQVLAHLNERKPDEGTGEIKPNFIKLSKAVGQGDDAQWQELGFGNAVNKRNDGKQVYFDEVLFNVDGKTIGARVGKTVDEEMHRKLGFLEERIARPEKEKAPADGAQDPKQKAPAANPEQAAPVETPGAHAPRKRSAARA